MSFWDASLILGVAGLGTAVAYLRHPEHKAFMLMLPVPFTLATLSLGRPVDAANVVAIVPSFGFTFGVWLLHARRQWPILVAIPMCAAAYCMVGALLMRWIPTGSVAFWTAAGAVSAGALTLIRVLPYRVEPHHRTPLPVWLKFPAIVLVIAGLIAIKHHLGGFMTMFPMLGVVATYEARHSLWALVRRFSWVALFMTCMMGVVRVTQSRIGLPGALAAAWPVLLLLLWLFRSRYDGSRSKGDSCVQKRRNAGTAAATGLLIVCASCGSQLEAKIVLCAQLDQGPRVVPSKAPGRTVRRVFPLPKKARDMEKLKQNVAYVMSLSETELRDMVPRQSGIYFTDCPNCDGSIQDRGNWEWLPQSPHRLTCKDCGEVYPDNPRYPDREFIEVAAPEGTHRYHYYETKDGYRIFFRAAADYRAKDYLAARCRDVAQLYATTGDARYARKAAVILARFAEVYPTWAYKYDYPFREKKFAPYTQNRIPGVTTPYRVSRWSWWAHMGISMPLLNAYEILKTWPGLAAMDDGNVQSRIEENLFVSMVEFVMGFPETYDNMSPGTWCSYIRAGRVLDRSDWVLEAARRTATFMERSFLYDGFWHESSPSYCSQVLGNMRNVAAALQGYTPSEDAPAAVTAALQTCLSRTRSGVRAIEKALSGTHMPHGGFVAINDTWGRHKNRCTPSRLTEPHLLPGLGLAILGGGSGKQQLHAWLDYTAGAGHQHRSVLGIGLFAHDNELLRDIGYTHTAWRSWANCTASHNTVVVDGVNSGLDRDRAKHRLRAFASDGRRFHLAEAESAAAKDGAQYGFVRNLRSGSASGSVCLDLRLSSAPAAGMRTHLAAHDGDVVYLGEAPRIRQAEGADVLLKDYYAPFFCVRRRGENLRSPFVAVHEPVKGPAKVRGIAATEVDGALLVAIDRGEAETDYFVMALDKPVSIVQCLGEAELHFEGRWGFARTRNGTATALHSVDASVLTVNDMRLQGIPAYRGIIRDVHRGTAGKDGSRGWFDVAETIAPGETIGALLVEFPDKTLRGYNVMRLEPLADGTRLHVAEDPAYDVRDGTVHLTSYPQRVIAGTTVHYSLPIVYTSSPVSPNERR